MCQGIQLSGSHNYEPDTQVYQFKASSHSRCNASMNAPGPPPTMPMRSLRFQLSMSCLSLTERGPARMARS